MLIALQMLSIQGLELPSYDGHEHALDVSLDRWIDNKQYGRDQS